MQAKIMQCTKCKTHKGKRYCLRNNKHICWTCCNDLRVDLLCPNECEYHAKENSDPRDNKVKADSLSEFYDFIDKHTRLWLAKKSSFFDNEIPILLKETAEGRAKLVEKLSSLNLDKKMAEIYEKHLTINLNAKKIPYEKSFEDIGFDFLQNLGEENWELLPMFLSPKDKVTNEKIITRLKNKKEIIDLKYFTVIASGLSKEGNSAFSSFELNYKTDFSLVFVDIQGEWKIDYFIFGEVNLLQSETESIKHIASFLANEQYDRAIQLIRQAEDIYYISPDLQYYKGLYYSLKGEKEEALKAFTEASELDTFFAEPIYNQAFIYHSDKNFEEAKRLYNKTLSMQSNNVNALNNLGTIYLFEKDYETAKSYFEKCLEISPDFKYAQENLKRIELLNQDL